MVHERAVIINKFWAGIFASVLASIVIGGGLYAWHANAQIAVMQSDVDQLKAARVSDRLARIEEQLKLTNQMLSAIVTERRK